MILFYFFVAWSVAQFFFARNEISRMRNTSVSCGCSRVFLLVELKLTLVFALVAKLCCIHG